MAGWLERLRRRVLEEDPEAAARMLAIFRLILGAALLWQALATAKDLPLLMGEFGLIQRSLNDALAAEGVPRIGWFVPAQAPAWLSEKRVIYLLFSLYLISIFYLMAGYRTRLFAGASLFFHLLFKASGAASAYGAHELATSALFFCLILPVDRFYALSGRRGIPLPETIDIGRLGLRAYMSVVYVSSGVEKLSGEAWRSGEAMWNFLMRPEVTVADFGWISQAPWLAAGVAWAVLVIEAGYALSLFLPRVRLWWLVLTVVLHLGIAITVNLWFFSLTMIALNVAALGGSPRLPHLKGMRFIVRPLERLLPRAVRPEAN
ncbi:MAG TPA: HTTM domain-containing protein [Bryobacteraceae bacterium]|nr:HTTM domain-containing protein [Bryobacteraceae bacterium]